MADASTVDITHKQKEARQARSTAEREAAYKAWRNNMSKENVALVDRIIRTMVDADFHADPQGSTNLERSRSYRRPDSTRDEGAGTRWARDWLRKLHRQVQPVLSEFDARVEGSYQPRSRDVEKVRCVNRTCVVVNRRIPRYVGADASIELVRCPKCDMPLTAAP